MTPDAAPGRWSELAVLSFCDDVVVIEDAPSLTREEADQEELIAQIISNSEWLGSRMRPLAGELGPAAADWIAKGWSQSLEYFYWSEQAQGGDAQASAPPADGCASGPVAGTSRGTVWSWDSELVVPPEVGPEPRTVGELLVGRRTHRHFDDRAVSPATLAGVLRSFCEHLPAPEDEPSLTGIGVNIVVYGVRDVAAGVWQLDRFAHALFQVRNGLFREAMSDLMCGMSAPLTASFTVVITCDMEARQRAFAYERALRELYVEAGRLAQWAVIAMETAGLGCLTTPAVEDRVLSRLLDLPPGRVPLYTITAGRKVSRDPGADASSS